MSREDQNKAIVGRWFTKFWGETCDLGIVDELAAPDMLLQYSLHEPRRGREDIKAFMTDFRGREDPFDGQRSARRVCFRAALLEATLEGPTLNAIALRAAGPDTMQSRSAFVRQSIRTHDGCD